MTENLIEIIHLYIELILNQESIEEIEDKKPILEQLIGLLLTSAHSEGL